MDEIDLQNLSNDFTAWTKVISNQIEDFVYYILGLFR